jgi:hypothetical protein
VFIRELHLSDDILALPVLSVAQVAGLRRPPGYMPVREKGETRFLHCWTACQA